MKFEEIIKGSPKKNLKIGSWNLEWTLTHPRAIADSIIIKSKKKYPKRKKVTEREREREITWALCHEMPL